MDEIKTLANCTDDEFLSLTYDIYEAVEDWFELTKIADLTQPGMFKAEETVTIKTTKSEINNVRILGPTRIYTQVEISKTDAYKLGLNPPIRNSGDLIDNFSTSLFNVTACICSI